MNKHSFDALPQRHGQISSIRILAMYPGRSSVTIPQVMIVLVVFANC